MRKIWLLALASFLFLQGVLFAQSITGIVTDAKTGQPLEGANIVLLSTAIGTSSDSKGQFHIGHLNRNAYDIRISYVGYESFLASADLREADVQLHVALQPRMLPGPEIEIMAMKATERISPVTFSDITASDIRENYFVQDIPALLSDLPSATFYSEGGSGVGYNYLRIRGFDQRRLAIMVNGVPQNDPEDHNVYWIDFADLLGSTEQIQVQRGAGSAFYGPPAIGGSINIVTGDFTNQKGVRITTGFGSYTTQRYALSIGSGLLDDRYALFGRLSKTTSDGYRDHSWVNLNSYYFAATRYDTDFTTRINVYGGPISDGLVYQGVPKFAVINTDERKKNYNYWEADANGYTYTQLRRPQEMEEFSQPHFEMLNEWKISEQLTFNSTLFYVIGQGYFDYDGTGYTDATYYRLTPEFGFSNVPDPINPLIRAYVDNRQVGWLPRVTLQHSGGTLTSGLELRRHRSFHWGKIQWAEGLPENLDPDRHFYEYRGGKDIASIYVQEMFRLSERVNVMANVQYIFNRYRLYDEKYIGTDFMKSYHLLNPRLGVNFNIDEHWNLYGNVSFTQREPRLKNLYDAAESSGGSVPQFEASTSGGWDFTQPLVEPEKLFNVEFGAGWATSSAKVLANAYIMDFKDEIVKSGQLDRFGQPVTGNASRTLHVGLEVSAHVALVEYLDLDINGLLSRSRLKEFSVWETDPSGGRAMLISLAGNRIAGFPEYLANARLTWRLNRLYASLSLKYVGDQFTDNFQMDENKVDASSVFNAIIGYALPPVLGFSGIHFRLGINNLFNALYAQSGEGNQFFVAAERNYFFDMNFDL